MGKTKKKQNKFISLKSERFKTYLYIRIIYLSHIFCGYLENVMKWTRSLTRKVF